MNAQELKINNIVNKVLGENERKLGLIALDDGDAIGNFKNIKDISNNIKQNSMDIRAKIGDIMPVIMNSFVDVDGKPFYAPGIEIVSDTYPSGRTIGLSGDGLTSYANLTGVNIGYAKKCIAARKHDLLRENFSEWHKTLDPEKEVLIRSCYNQVNAILSDRYTIFDDNEVLDCVYDVLGPSREYAVKNYSLTPSGLNLRVVSRNIININGDDLSFGFDIRNSNIGKSSVEIAIIIYRWICSNGLIVGGGKGYMMRQRHVSVDRESLVRNFVELLDQSPYYVAAIKENIEKSMDTRLNSDSMQKIIDTLKANGMIQNAINRVEEYIEPQYANTVWGVVNGITRLSQDYSLETRLRMEKIAGQVLSKYSA